MPGFTDERVLTFAAGLLISGVVGIYFANLLAFSYRSLATYHYGPDGAREDGHPREAGESIGKKLKLVYRLNLLTAIPTAGVLAVLRALQDTGNATVGTTGGLQLPTFTPQLILVASLLTALLNMFLRLSAFTETAYWWYDESFEFERSHIRDDIMGFGYSFFSSFYVTLFVIFEIGVLFGSVPLTVTLPETLSLYDMTTYTALLLVGVFLTTAVLEGLLWHIQIPAGLKDPIEETRE